jgi:hypothetical protein
VKESPIQSRNCSNDLDLFLTFIQALKESYPEKAWNSKERSNWKEVTNQRQFFDTLAKSLNVNNWEDWYSVSAGQVVRRGGTFIKNYYRGSMIKGNYISTNLTYKLPALKAAYPEYNWKVEPRKNPEDVKPLGYWNDVTNQRIFFDKLARSLKLESPHDWYSVSLATVLQHGGFFVRHKYSSLLEGTKDVCTSLTVLALKKVYPEHDWKKDLKSPKPVRYWQDKQNQRQFFDKLALSLNITKPQDWYFVDLKTIIQRGGYFVLDYYNGSLIQALNELYPHFQLKRSKRGMSRYRNGETAILKSQTKLYTTLKALFPEVNLQQKARIKPDVIQSQNVQLPFIEFDVSNYV